MSWGVEIDVYPQNVSPVLSHDILWSGRHFDADLWWVDEVGSEIIDCESVLEWTISACGFIREMAMHDSEDDLCSSDDEEEGSMQCHGMAGQVGSECGDMTYGTGNYVNRMWDGNSDVDVNPSIGSDMTMTPCVNSIVSVTVNPGVKSNVRVPPALAVM